MVEIVVDGGVAIEILVECLLINSPHLASLRGAADTMGPLGGQGESVFMTEEMVGLEIGLVLHSPVLLPVVE